MSLRFCQMSWLPQLTYYPSTAPPFTQHILPSRLDRTLSALSSPSTMYSHVHTRLVSFSSFTSVHPASASAFGFRPRLVYDLPNSSHLVCRAYFNIVYHPACFVQTTRANWICRLYHLLYFFLLPAVFPPPAIFSLFELLLTFGFSSHFLPGLRNLRVLPIER